MQVFLWIIGIPSMLFSIGEFLLGGNKLLAAVVGVSATVAFGAIGIIQVIEKAAERSSPPSGPKTA
jgi:hypothetical protein